MPNGLIVAALVAVNAAGDIIDPDTGKVVAGARNADGRLRRRARAAPQRRADAAPQPPRRARSRTPRSASSPPTPGSPKPKVSRLALMGDDGYARAIFPSHTMGDGDTVFSLATGTLERRAPTSSLIGALAADAMAKALVQRGHAGDRPAEHPGRARPEEVNLHLALLLAYSRGAGRRSACGSAAASAAPRTSSSPAAARPGADLLDDAGGEHRRGIDGRRDRRSATATAWPRGGGSDRRRSARSSSPFWIGPAMRRVAAAHDLRTVGDYLEFRYGPRVRGIVALLLWVGSLFDPRRPADRASRSILNVVAGAPKWSAARSAASLITIYFVGRRTLKSGAWVNMVQLTVKLAGFAIALPLALDRGRRLARRSRAMPAAVGRLLELLVRRPSGSVYLAMLGPGVRGLAGAAAEALTARATIARCGSASARTRSDCCSTRSCRCSSA